jgi:hypothetical protein
LIPSDKILRETFIRTSLEYVCEFLRAVPLYLNVPIAVERMAVTHRYLSEPRLRVVADRDDRYSGNSVEAFDHIVVVYVVSLVENHDERVLDGVLEELVNIVDGGTFGELIADVSWMLTERLAKDRTGTLAEASDVSVRDGSSFFKPIERMAREYRFPDTAGAADQGVMWGRSTECRLKRTRELTHL